MSHTTRWTSRPVLAFASAAALGACGTESDGGITGALTAHPPSFAMSGFSDWSAPVNLGPPVNTPFAEVTPFISKDGLSLYFASPNRPGGFGGFDLWVSQRASVDDPWGAPQNLGPTINTSFNEQSPTLSLDGHRLYFNSDQPGGFGGIDLYVSRRRDKTDDFGWQTAVNLGGAVNTPTDEFQAAPFEGDDTGATTLYFTKRPGGAGGEDIYASTLGADDTFGPPALVAELSSPFNDRAPAISRDGLEMFLTSDRPGTLGPFDVWMATRANTADAWSTSVNLTSVNSGANDARAALSFDGTALYIQSNRPGGLGMFDLYMSTRRKLKESHED